MLPFLKIDGAKMEGKKGTDTSIWWDEYVKQYKYVVYKFVKKKY